MKTSDSDRIVEGYGTVEIVDNQGDFVPVSKIAEIMPTYMKRGGVLMDTHTNRHVGTILDWKLIDDDGKPAMWLKTQIFNDFSIDNMIWDAIKEGHYTGFSFGGRSLDKEIVCDGAMCHNRINDLEMWEWSIVPKPANKLSTIKHFSGDGVAKGGNILAKGLIPELSSEGDIVYRMIDVAIGDDELNKSCSCKEEEKGLLDSENYRNYAARDVIRRHKDRLESEPEEEDEKAHLEPLDHIRREPCPLKRQDSGRSHAGYQKAREMPERIEKEDEYMEEEKAYGYHGQNTSRNMEFGHKPFRPNPQDVNRERNTRHDIGAYGKFDAHDMAQVDPGDKDVRGQIESDYKARSATGKNDLKARKTGERYDRLSEREKSDMEYEEEKAANPRHGYHGRDSKAERDYTHDEVSLHIPKVPPRDITVYGDESDVKAPAKSRADTKYHHEMKDAIRWNQSGDTDNYKTPGPKSKNMEKEDMEYEEEKAASQHERFAAKKDPRSKFSSRDLDDYSEQELLSGSIQPRSRRETRNQSQYNKTIRGALGYEDNEVLPEHKEKSDMDYYEKEDTPVSPPSSGSDAPLNKILSKLEALESRLTKLEGGEKKEGQAFSQMAEEHKGEEEEKAETPKTVTTPQPDQYGAGPSAKDDHLMGSDKKLAKSEEIAGVVKDQLMKMGFRETPRPAYNGAAFDLTGAGGPMTVADILSKAAESGVANVLGGGSGNDIHKTLSRLSYRDIEQVMDR